MIKNIKMPLNIGSYNYKRDCSTTTGSSSGSGQQSPSSYSQTPSTDSSASEDAIMSSLVFCIHHKDGCNWSDELRKLKGHLNTCRYDSVSCPSTCGALIPRLLLEDHLKFTCNLRRTTCKSCNKVFTGEELENHHGSCAFEPIFCENKCGNKVPRKILPQHLQSECPKRLTKCASCRKEFSSDTLTLHISKCGRVPVNCERCGASSIPREEMDAHYKEKCLEMIMLCPFKDAGCKFKGQKRCLESHMENNSRQHLSLLCGVITKQSQQISCLRNAMSKLSLDHSGTLMWKITDFAAKMKEAQGKEGVELISAPFYTSQHGYKLQASLFLNGNGVGEGTHVSVYIKILPGEYDSILKWPFSHAVSFTLYDQHSVNAEKTLNIAESFNPDPTWTNFQRPSREPDSLGFGFPRFASHETLMKRSYVKDDTLFLRIKVEPGKIVAV